MKDKIPFWVFINSSLVVMTIAMAALFWFGFLVDNISKLEWYQTFMLLFLPAHTYGLMLHSAIKGLRMMKGKSEVITWTKKT